MSEHACPTCDRVFETRRGLAVHHAHTHDTLLPNRQCDRCGTQFHADHEVAYCSDACRDAAVSVAGADNPNYRDASERGTCRLCDSTFEYYPSEKPGLYCPSCVETEQWRTVPTADGADNPQWSGGRQSVACAVCGTEVERWPSEINDTTVCSDACRQEWLSDAFTGEGHPNWQGGPTGPYGPGWAAVRRNALERDDHQCRLCGAMPEDIGRNPDVHHIRPVRQFVDSDAHSREDAHDLENVISLCPDCHRSADFGAVSPDRLRALI